MMMAFNFPVKGALVQPFCASAFTLACQAAKFAVPLGPLTWFDTGGPRTTNSRCMLGGSDVPLSRQQHLTSNPSLPARSSQGRGWAPTHALVSSACPPSPSRCRDAVSRELELG